MQRSAGRFQPYARRPDVRAAQPQPVQPAQQPLIAPAYSVADLPVPPKPHGEVNAAPFFDLPGKTKRSPIDRIASAIGLTLACLLPLLTAALAWRQRDALRAAILPLLLDESAADIVQWIVYIVLSLLAALVSALPGLWTLCAARRPAPRGKRHSAARK